MTVATSETGTRPVPEGHVRLTIDGREVDAPQGELVIRSCERVGIVVPRFCDHPLLDPVAACRQCLVEVEMGGRPMPKPQASCALTVADGMVVRTQHTSAVADKAQQGVMELLLINHPLDCPVCDKGGECPLQNQAMSNGRGDSRFVEPKRTFAKPLPISTQVLLDRERCILCARCTRFSEQIAGDEFIDMLERGPHQQVGVAADTPFQSYFSGNTIQICPVGALTSTAYRFRSRPFDLVSTPGICEHCASGCAQRTDWRRSTVQRRLAGNDPEVNEEWNCDKGRFAFTYARAEDRILRPLVRDGGGTLQPASWTEALATAARGLTQPRGRRVGVLPGGRLTVEDAYAYAKFARVALHTNDIDFRARPHSVEELEFLTAVVVGDAPGSAHGEGALRGGVSYADLSAAPAVLCVAFEPEEESPIVFLRLRRAARDAGTTVYHLASWTSPAVVKTSPWTGPGEQDPRRTMLPAMPGGEPETLDALPEEVLDELRAEGAVVLVGERAAEVDGLFSAVARLAATTGARVAWVPRRAGERGALEAGAVPTLLPGGRPVTDDAARAEVEAAWGEPVPAQPGRDTTQILAAVENGALAGLVVGGLDPDDLPDPELARRALRAVRFLVSLELRHSAVTEHADVVLPVAPAVEKAGSYLNWEGRRREFGTTITGGPSSLPDCRILDSLAMEMDADLLTQTPAAAAADLAKLGGYHGARPDPPAVAAPPQPSQPGAGDGQALLATWRRLLDNGSMQDGEPHLAGTARSVTALLSETTAAGLGVRFGDDVTVSTTRGSVTLPAQRADLPDGVVWLPTNSGSSTVRRSLGVGHGAVVTVGPAAARQGGALRARVKRSEA